MLTIRVIGMRRSGNHAIIHWLLANYNNGLPVKNHYDTNIKHKATILTNNIDILFFNNCQISPFWSIFSKLTCEIDILNYKLILHSYEDQLLEHIKECSYNQCFDKENDIINIIIIRDPLNTFASRVQHIHNNIQNNTLTKVDEYHINLWCSYVEEALNITNHFKNKIFIYYDKWLIDKNYRNYIANQLSVYNFDNITYVSFCGNGSSFIGQQLDQPQNYLERYKLIKFSDEILPLLTSDKIRYFTNKINQLLDNIQKIDIS